MKIQQFSVVSGDQTLDIRSVPLTSLIVDGSYQRTEYHAGKRIDEISNKLDFQIAGLLKVIERSGDKYAVTDGGSRLAGIKRRYPAGLHKDGSPVMIAVQVMPGSGSKIEAKLTEAANLNVKPFNSLSAFKTRLKAGNSAEVEIVKQLQDIGVMLLFGPGSMPANHTNSAAAFRRAYDIVGRERFGTELLPILKSYQRPNYDGTIERHALRPDFVVAMAKLMVAKERPYKFDSLYRNLSRSYPAADIFAIAARKEKNGGGENRMNVLVECIREAYVAGGESDGAALRVNLHRVSKRKKVA